MVNGFRHCHQLDFATSGVLCFALSKKAAGAADDGPAGAVAAAASATSASRVSSAATDARSPASRSAATSAPCRFF